MTVPINPSIAMMKFLDNLSAPPSAKDLLCEPDPRPFTHRPITQGTTAPDGTYLRGTSRKKVRKVAARRWASYSKEKQQAITDRRYEFLQLIHFGSWLVEPRQLEPEWVDPAPNFTSLKHAYEWPIGGGR